MSLLLVHCVGTAVKCLAESQCLEILQKSSHGDNSQSQVLPSIGCGKRTDQWRRFLIGTPLFSSAGKRGITEGLGLTIRQHFYRHAFAKVSLKQRPNGITVKECMIELEVGIALRVSVTASLPCSLL
jgi:hypothetical protein